ncbi:MAG: hypothetical protein LPK49_01695, partial [Bacteroidota bacterium]|nr:hypothetical protein [Bacteroidota bacterium]
MKSVLNTLPMKTMPLLFSLGLSLLLVSMISCRKEKGKGIDEPIMQVPIDSGTYDPDSWLPLKFGARWEYLHDNGETEIVTCGPLVHDTTKSMYGTKYPFVGHYLTNSLAYSKL